MAKSKRGGSSDIAVLGLAPRSAPPNAKGALVKANAVNSSAQCDLIERVTIKGMVWFAIGVLSPRTLAEGVNPAAADDRGYRDSQPRKSSGSGLDQSRSSSMRKRDACKACRSSNNVLANSSVQPVSMNRR